MVYGVYVCQVLGGTKELEEGEEGNESTVRGLHEADGIVMRDTMEWVLH